MGVYMSSPVTEKESVDGQWDRFVYGASSMQGWRMSQEDAHNCIPLFDEKTKTSFFAVYDGHGGPEVAKYCEKYFPEFVKNLMDKHGDTEDPACFIKKAFLEFDATLTNEDVIKELKELAGNGDDDEDEDDDPVGRSETELLKEEANMPLDQLLAQYKNATLEEIKNSQTKFQSSEVLMSKNESSSIVGCSSQDAQNGLSSSSVSTISSSCRQASSSQISNGEHCSHNSSETGYAQIMESVNTTSDQHPSNCNNNTDKTTSSSTHNCFTSTVTDEPLSPLSPNKTKQAADNHCSSSSSKSADANIQDSSSSLDSAQPGGSTSGATSSLDMDDGPSVSRTSSSAGIRSSKAKAAVETAKIDGDIDSSDDDEDEEDIWEDMSDDDDDDDEEDAEDEGVPMMNMSDEEPGSDSGCTACVVLIQGKRLIVANAGDSRCVLSRAGKAVDLSFDHKPEDDSEKDRIENAGGKVTADGRVNGGLNLSRAIGDHVYKRKTDLPAEEQMITALPDVETAELCDDDQFIVIACDGIWNYMTSQEVVDFVLQKLDNPEIRQKPSAVCEELFDHCLAPNTSGDGTGCDNMTCIIIVLNTSNDSKAQPTLPEATHTNEAAIKSTENLSEQQLSSVNESGDAGLGKLKRTADSLKASEEKRLKFKEELA